MKSPDSRARDHYFVQPEVQDCIQYANDNYCKFTIAGPNIELEWGQVLLDGNDTAKNIRDEELDALENNCYQLKQVSPLITWSRPSLRIYINSILEQISATSGRYLGIKHFGIDDGGAVLLVLLLEADDAVFTAKIAVRSTDYALSDLTKMWQLKDTLTDADLADQKFLRRRITSAKLQYLDTTAGSELRLLASVVDDDGNIGIASIKVNPVDFVLSIRGMMTVGKSKFFKKLSQDERGQSTEAIQDAKPEALFFSVDHPTESNHLVTKVASVCPASFESWNMSFSTVYSNRTNMQVVRCTIFLAVIKRNDIDRIQWQTILTDVKSMMRNLNLPYRLTVDEIKPNDQVLLTLVKYQWRVNVPKKSNCYDIETGALLTVASAPYVASLQHPIPSIPMNKHWALMNESVGISSIGSPINLPHFLKMKSDDRPMLVVVNHLRDTQEYNFNVIVEHSNDVENIIVPKNIHYPTRPVTSHNGQDGHLLNLLFYRNLNIQGIPSVETSIIIDRHLIFPLKDGICGTIPLISNGESTQNFIDSPDMFPLTHLTVFDDDNKERLKEVAMIRVFDVLRKSDPHFRYGAFCYLTSQEPSRLLSGLELSQKPIGDALIEASLALEFAMASQVDTDGRIERMILQSLQIQMRNVVLFGPSPILKYCIQTSPLLQTIRLDIVALMLSKYEASVLSMGKPAGIGEVERVTFLFELIDDTLQTPPVTLRDYSLVPFRASITALAVQRRFHLMQDEQCSFSPANSTYRQASLNLDTDTLYDAYFNNLSMTGKGIHVLGGPLLGQIFRLALDHHPTLKATMKLILRYGLTGVWDYLSNNTWHSATSSKCKTDHKDVIGWCSAALSVLSNDEQLSSLTSASVCPEAVNQCLKPSAYHISMLLSFLKYISDNDIHARLLLLKQLDMGYVLDEVMMPFVSPSKCGQFDEYPKSLQIQSMIKDSNVLRYLLSNFPNRATKWLSMAIKCVINEARTVETNLVQVQSLKTEHSPIIDTTALDIRLSDALQDLARFIASETFDLTTENKPDTIIASTSSTYASVASTKVDLVAHETDTCVIPELKTMIMDILSMTWSSRPMRTDELATIFDFLLQASATKEDYERILATMENGNRWYTEPIDCLNWSWRLPNLVLGSPAHQFVSTIMARHYTQHLR